MTDPTTPFQKRSDTSKKAAAEKDATGTTLDQDEILLAFFQERGARGVYIFEAAEHLTARLGYEVVPGTASGRINDLMKDEKCQRWFGCNALVKKSKVLPRKDNPKSGKSAGAYVLKSFEPDDGRVQTSQPSSDVREAGATAATVAPAAAAPKTLAEIENAMPEGGAYKAWMNEVPPAAPLPDAKTIVYEAPDAHAKEVLETTAGRRVAADVRAGRAPQLDFGFGPQLRPVR